MMFTGSLYFFLVIQTFDNSHKAQFLLVWAVKVVLYLDFLYTLAAIEFGTFLKF